MRISLLLPAIAIVLVVCVADANAKQLMLQPNSVIAQPPMGQFNSTTFAANNLINQSGLSSGYTSGVTDFDTYIASSPTHNGNLTGSIWFSTQGNRTGDLEFDLGSILTIQSMALWNRGSDASDNIIGFTLFADDNAAFSSPTSLGGFTANPNTGSTSAVLPEVFTFTPTAASHVRLRITSPNGSGLFTSAGEVAFESSAIPEPTSLLLFATGCAVLMRRRR